MIGIPSKISNHRIILNFKQKKYVQIFVCGSVLLHKDFIYFVMF